MFCWPISAADFEAIALLYDLKYVAPNVMNKREKHSTVIYMHVWYRSLCNNQCKVDDGKKVNCNTMREIALAYT